MIDASPVTPAPASADSTPQLEHAFRHHRRGLTQAARRLVPASEAEDLVADVFLGLVTATANGRGPDSTTAGYLARSLHHSAMRSWRRRERAAAAALTAGPPVATAGVDVQVVEAAVIRAAFRSLPPRWQHVLWLTVVEDWPLNRVARAIGLRSAAAAAVLAQRARAGLRRAVDATDAYEPLNGTLSLRRPPNLGVCDGSSEQ